MSIVSTDRNGFSKNILNGQDLDDANHVSFRSDWFFDISDSASLRVFGQFFDADNNGACLLYTSPSPRDRQKSRMPSSA